MTSSSSGQSAASFNRSTEALAALLAQTTSTTYDDLVHELRQQHNLPQLFLDLYAETSPRDMVVQAFEHGGSTFVYDAPSWEGEAGDDRTVVALGVSRWPLPLGELLAGAEQEMAGENSADAAVALVPEAIDSHAHAYGRQDIESQEPTPLRHRDAAPARLPTVTTRSVAAKAQQQRALRPFRGDHDSR